MIVAGTGLTAEVIPMPVMETRCGLPGAVSVMVSVPVRVPVAVGLNETVISQVAWGAIVVMQLVDRVKSPLIVMFVTVREVLPTFVNRTFVVGLMFPT